jgi:hypothetical protein
VPEERVPYAWYVTAGALEGGAQERFSVLLDAAVQLEQALVDLHDRLLATARSPWLAVETSRFDLELVQWFIDELQTELSIGIDPEISPRIVSVGREIARATAERYGDPNGELLLDEKVQMHLETFAGAADGAAGDPVGTTFHALDQVPPDPSLGTLTAVFTEPRSRWLFRVKRFRSSYYRTWRQEVWGRIDWLRQSRVLGADEAAQVNPYVRWAIANVQRYSVWAELVWRGVIAGRRRILWLSAIGLSSRCCSHRDWANGYGSSAWGWRCSCCWWPGRCTGSSARGGYSCPVPPGGTRDSAPPSSPG